LICVGLSSDNDDDQLVSSFEGCLNLKSGRKYEQKFICWRNLRPFYAVRFFLLSRLKFQAFDLAEMEQGNKVCFDQLNSIFAKN
jgi:hypothetical protein